MSDDSSSIQVILPLEDFAEDLEQRLGRANGNIYHRRPGIEGVHDGQVMVRLKKKRFIVLDYSIVPNEADFHHAAMSSYIRCPDGAGKAPCTAAGCNKVGVPVLLYDSEPHEPQSLYLRSGLCFTCQRNLNEKRRTQRKKPDDHKEARHLTEAPRGPKKGKASVAASPYVPSATAVAAIVPYHQVLMAVSSGNKRIKLAHTNEPLTLAQDAIILNGPPDPTCKSARHGHGFNEIGIDLAQTAKQSLESTQALIQAVDPTSNGTDLGLPSHLHHHHRQYPPTSEDISRLYETSFAGLCKSLYLLTQWKESWDAAMAAAVHAQHMVVPPPVAAIHHHMTNAIPDIHHPLSPQPIHHHEDDALHHHHQSLSHHGMTDAVSSTSVVTSVDADNQPSHPDNLQDGDDSVKADPDLMAAAAAAAAADPVDGSHGDGDDDDDAGVIEL
jgi:hypothetical protein